MKARIPLIMLLLLSLNLGAQEAQVPLPSSVPAPPTKPASTAAKGLLRKIPLPSPLRLMTTAIGVATGVAIEKYGRDERTHDGFEDYISEDLRESFTGGLLETSNVDADHPESGALLVALHGCTQDIEIFKGATELSAKALPQNIDMLYGQQSNFRNMNTCWNWFLSTSKSKWFGESRQLMRMIQKVMAANQIPPDRVYVVGFSAGAAQAANLLACYPNFFRKAFLVSGTSYGVASILNAGKVLKEGVDAIGLRTHTCDPRKHVQPVYVFHGDQDESVHPSHAGLIAEDFSSANVEVNLLEGISHQWSGGHPDYKYTAPDAPNLSDRIIFEINKDRGLNP